MLRSVPLFIAIHHKVEGLSTEAVVAAHRTAHGLMADEIVEVREGA